MDRRGFLVTLGAAAASLPSRLGGMAQSSSSAARVRVHVYPERPLRNIPRDFIGLGYEISSVATPGLLSAKNRKYVQLVRTLGANGVIRIGGNTSDDASFSPNAQAVSAPKGTVVNEANLRDLGSFLRATGWRLIWGLNLGSGSEERAAVEAQAVSDAVQENLLAFEIGNETDLFGHKRGHRPTGYSYEDYLREYRRYKAAIRAKLPNAPFAGPDAATSTDWVTRFAVDEGNDLKLLTHHYYRECANPTSTLDKLLHPDPKLLPELEKLKAASAASRVPYRICETNSFCGGGKPGVSDTFGAALWVLDFLFTLASQDAAGVNIETGVNQLGFISSYSPIGDDERGSYSSKPPYYGMLAFSHASEGQQVSADCDASGVNLTAYAVLNGRKDITVTLINKDASRDAAVTISADQPLANAGALRLSGPSLDSKDTVTLGGSAVDPNGSWKPSQRERLSVTKSECEIHVRAGSAAIVNLRR